VLLTFGLLSPNKGIENVIRALPAILARHPNVVYIVSGVTHPHIRRRDGERYREELQALAEGAWGFIEPDPRQSICERRGVG
jgi:glycosyltransferase involved in cell wall biosynthesis